MFIFTDQSIACQSLKIGKSTQNQNRNLLWPSEQKTEERFKAKHVLLKSFLKKSFEKVIKRFFVCLISKLWLFGVLEQVVVSRTDAEIVK